MKPFTNCILIMVILALLCVIFYQNTAIQRLNIANISHENNIEILEKLNKLAQKHGAFIRKENEKRKHLIEKIQQLNEDEWANSQIPPGLVDRLCEISECQ